MSTRNFKDFGAGKLVQNANAKPQPSSEEQAYLQLLAVADTQPVKDPIVVLTEELSAANQQLNINRRQLKPDVQFLALHELFQVGSAGSASERDQHVDNTISLLKNMRVQKFRDEHFKKAQLTAAFMEKLHFNRATHGKYYMQKKGKVLGSNKVRPCFITQEHFGKIRKDNTQKQSKLVLFKNQTAIVQAKKDVDEKKDLPWEETKDKSPYRVLFTERSADKRQRAIYMPDLESAKLLRDHCMVQGLLAKTSQVATVRKLKDHYRTKLSEVFLMKILQTYFKQNRPAQNRAAIENVRTKLQAYVQEKYPDAGKPKVTPAEGLRFDQNDHLNLKLKEPEAAPKQGQAFATLINPVELPNESTINRKITQNDKSVFFNDGKSQVQYQINMTSFPQKPPHVFSSADKQNFLKFVFSNCRVFLQVENILVEGENANKHYEFVLAIGDHVLSANAFLINNDLKNFLYGTQFWTEISYPQLEDITVAITGPEGAVAAETLNLKSQLDSISLKMPFFSNLKIAKGQNPKLRVSLFGDLVLMPKSLEIAHAFLDSGLIALNFDRFAELFKTCETPNAYLANFFPAGYSRLANSYARVVKGFRPYLESVKMLVHSFGSNMLRPLLGKCAPTGDWAAMFASVSQYHKTKNEEILDSHKIYNLDCYCFYLARGISPIERFWIAENLIKLKNKDFVNFRPLEESFWSPSFVSEISYAIDNFQKKYPSLATHRPIVVDICNTLQIMFENNKVNDQHAPIHFSPHYVGIVCHYVDLCARDLTSAQITTICTNLILMTLCLPGYTRINFYNQLDGLYAFFSLLLRTAHIDLFISLVRFGQDWNSILSQCVLGAFSAFVDSSAFGAVNDLITGIVLLLYSRGSRIIDGLQAYSLEIGAVVMSFVLVEAFTTKKEYLLNVRRAEFDHIIRSAVSDVIVNLEEHLPSILGLFQVCEQADWFLPHLAHMQENLNPRNNELRLAFLELQACLQSTKTTSEQILQFGVKEFHSEVFMSIIRSLLHIKEPSAPKCGDSIDADIFFEVLQHYDMEEQDEKIRRNEMLATALVHYFCGLNPVSRARNPISSLSNIAELDTTQLENYFYELNIGGLPMKEAAGYMKLIYPQKRYPVFGTVLITGLAVCKSLKEQVQFCSQVATELTKLFFPNEQKRFLNVVCNAIRE